MAKKEQPLDNLRYIFAKDARTGERAGFNVQAVRDRLTEIQYDLDHIQGDIDQIINGDLTNIYQDIKDINIRIDNLEQEFNEFKKEITEEINQRFEELTQYIEQQFALIRQEIAALEGELNEVKRTYEHFPTGTRLLFYQRSAPPGWSVVPGLDDAILRVNSVTGGSLVNGTTFTQRFKTLTSSAEGAHTIAGSTTSATVAASSSTSSTTLSESQMPRHKHSGGSGGNDGIDRGPEPPHKALAGRDDGAISTEDWEKYWANGKDGTGQPGNMMTVGYAYVASTVWNEIQANSFIGRTKSVGDPGKPGYKPSEAVPGFSIRFQRLDNVLGGSEAGGGAGHDHYFSFNSGPHSHTFSQSVSSHTHTLDLTVKNISVIVCQKEIVF